MNDEQFLLANAYLDGELTAEERAVADADPDVMAAVEELRALQARVRDVDPPSDVVRDTAIAAAMAQFAPAGTDAEHGVTAFAPRRPYGRYLAVAAGVLGVGLFGVAVANLGTSGGDDSADDAASMEPAAEEPAEARITEDAPFAAERADDTAGDMADDMATAEAPAEEPASEEPAMDSESDVMDEPAGEPAEEPADGGGVDERPELLPDQVLSTPEELGSFGTGLVEQLRAGTLGSTPNHACPIDEVLGRTEFLSDATGGEVTWLLVAIDEPAGIVLGFDQDTCEFVADGPLYLP